MARLLLTLVASVMLGATSSCSLTNPQDAPLRIIWTNSTTPSSSLSITSEGAADDERFYAVRGLVGESRVFSAFRQEDGAPAWTARVVQPCSPPILSPGRVFCAASQMYAFDSRSGRPLWTTDVGASLQLVRGTADATRVFGGTSDFSGADTEAYGFDAATGSVLWRRQFSGDGWIGARLRSLTLTPEGDLLAALVALYPPQNSTNNAAVVVALDPATGAERWRFQDGGSDSHRNIGGLTIWEDLVLYNDNTGGQEAVAFSRTTREVVWRAPWTPGFVGTVHPPQVADGTAYFADGGGTTFAVDARTGAQHWSRNAPGGASSLEVCGPIVLMNNGLGEVLDRATGRHRGRLLDFDDDMGQIAVAGNVLYVSAQSGVYAFDCTS